MATFRSVAVILSVQGAELDVQALDGLPCATVLRAEFARGERATCAAATLAHDVARPELHSALSAWAAGRGWSVTIAPVHGSG